LSRVRRPVTIRVNDWSELWRASHCFLRHGGSIVSDVLVTRDGMEDLIAEIDRLHGERDAFVRRIKRALEDGGAVAENGEYLDARHDTQLLDVRIAELERRLRAAAIVEPVRDGDLGIGENVSVRDLATHEVFHFRIVGTGESDPSVGDLSHESPVGSALLGRGVGEVVEVDSPSGAVRLEVIAVDG
jgi:transcription elongation factor GreA